MNYSLLEQLGFHICSNIILSLQGSPTICGYVRRSFGQRQRQEVVCLQSDNDKGQKVLFKKKTYLLFKL